MSFKITRRDFLKLSLLSAAAGAAVLRESGLAQVQPVSQPNILVILPDTLSARHLPLYGYARDTAPNLTRFAENAIVYHKFHSTANFTMPSTASLMTGTYPWTHRGFWAIPEQGATDGNIFSRLSESHYISAYTQNLLADILLYQFASDINQHVGTQAFSSIGSPASQLRGELLSNDGLFSTIGTEGYYFSNRNKAGSLFLSVLDRLFVKGKYKLGEENYKQSYPAGLPQIHLHNVYFKQEMAFEGLSQMLSELPEPFFAYCHLWSPHEPYRAGTEFQGSFDDELDFPRKERHFLTPSPMPQKKLDRLRREYDENIAHVDAEFGRLLQRLKDFGILDRSYVIVTSDHGQMFERGVHGHTNQLLYEPLLHIPLLVSKPGQRDRQDIFSLNSNVDLLPTLLHLSGLKIPDWIEGEVLPGLGGQADENREIYAIEAKGNASHQPLMEATLAILQDKFKLIKYMGYPGYDEVTELYNLQDDPEELENLAAVQSGIAGELDASLMAKLAEADEPYRSG